MALKVGVPNLFIKGWMEEKFAQAVQEAAQKACGWKGEVLFSVASDLFQDMRAEEAVARSEPSPAAAETPATRVEPQEANPRMCLDDFVVAQCNQLAYAAAMEVCFQFEPAFNRLFIHGGVGLGKTHMLQGMWQKLRDQTCDGQAIYTTAEKWTNHYIYALTSNRLEGFRQKYRTVKYLLIDDVHFLKNKQGIQEEFLHTFDALDSSNKRIILASDSHPHDLEHVTKNLITRFLSGMVAKLDAPDEATRERILRTKMRRTRYRLPDDVLAYMAEYADVNIRELEGLVTKIVALASLNRAPITVDLARECMADLSHTRSAVVTIKDIEHEVSEATGVTRSEMHSKRRTRLVSRARHICMYLSRQLTHKSCRDIGSHFGGMKHSSVLSACKSMQERLEEDADLARMVSRLKDKLGG